jgi:hypothetical protein
VDSVIHIHHPKHCGVEDGPTWRSWCLNLNVKNRVRLKTTVGEQTQPPYLNHEQKMVRVLSRWFLKGKVSTGHNS